MIGNPICAVEGSPMTHDRRTGINIQMCAGERSSYGNAGHVAFGLRNPADYRFAVPGRIHAADGYFWGDSLWGGDGIG